MRALQRTLRMLALVPIATGALSVLTGSHTLPARGQVAASVESELRFYAVWWIGAGLLLWWLAPQVAERRELLTASCALLFAGGVARLLAAADAGWPSPGQIALLAVELALPVAILAWDAWARAAAQKDGWARRE